MKLLIILCLTIIIVKNLKVDCTEILNQNKLKGFENSNLSWDNFDYSQFNKNLTEKYKKNILSKILILMAELMNKSLNAENFELKILEIKNENEKEIKLFISKFNKCIPNIKNYTLKFNIDINEIINQILKLQENLFKVLQIEFDPNFLEKENKKLLQKEKNNLKNEEKEIINKLTTQNKEIKNEINEIKKDEKKINDNQIVEEIETNTKNFNYDDINISSLFKLGKKEKEDEIINLSSLFEENNLEIDNKNEFIKKLNSVYKEDPEAQLIIPNEENVELSSNEREEVELENKLNEIENKISNIDDINNNYEECLKEEEEIVNEAQYEKITEKLKENPKVEEIEELTKKINLSPNLKNKIKNEQNKILGNSLKKTFFIKKKILSINYDDLVKFLIYVVIFSNNEGNLDFNFRLLMNEYSIDSINFYHELIKFFPNLKKEKISVSKILKLIYNNKKYLFLSKNNNKLNFVKLLRDVRIRIVNEFKLEIISQVFKNLKKNYKKIVFNKILTEQEHKFLRYKHYIKNISLKNKIFFPENVNEFTYKMKLVIYNSLNKINNYEFNSKEILRSSFNKLFVRFNGEIVNANYNRYPEIYEVDKNKFENYN